MNNKINESKIALALAEKKTTGDLLYEPPSPESIKREAKKGKEAKPVPVEFERRLQLIESEISTIYKKHVNQTEVSGKSPVALLDVSILNFNIII